MPRRVIARRLIYTYMALNVLSAIVIAGDYALKHTGDRWLSIGFGVFGGLICFLTFQQVFKIIGLER